MDDGLDTRAIERPPVDILSAFWFFVSVLVFVGLGLMLKTRILNWIYGPLFPLFFLYVVPTALRRLYRLPRDLWRMRAA